MKTALEWFNTLPQPWRDAAIRNCVPYRLHQEFPELEEALLSCFVWHDSPEGHEAWANVCYDELTPQEPTFTVSEIAAYLSGWQGSDTFPAAYHNALTMLTDDQDGIVAQRERGTLKLLMP